MSYVLDITLDAKSDWRELPFHLQELVLDELDRLCAAPPRRRSDEVYHDLVYEAGGTVCYIFLHLLVEHSRRTLTVLGVTKFERPARR